MKAAQQDRTSDETNPTNVLGIRWATDTDRLSLSLKKLLRHCTICRRYGGKPYAAPESPPLPKVRVQDTPPFSITGVDFTGALFVKQNKE